MNDFFNSKFIQDLEQGKLPPVEVSIPDESLVKLFVGTFVTVVAILVVAYVLRKS